MGDAKGNEAVVDWNNRPSAETKEFAGKSTTTEATEKSAGA